MMDSSYHELDDTKARARNLLTCPLCSQPYDDPRVLHCQHTFCCRCLQAYIDRLQADWTALPRSSSGSRLGSFHCPTCLVDVGLPSAGAVAFPVDRRIQNIKNLMVEEMMQDIARKLKSKLGNTAEQNNVDAAGADKTGAKHSSGGHKSDKGHHRSSRLGDIHESGSLEDDNDKLFERDTSHNSRSSYDTLPSSFGRQKPGYSSLREPKRASRPRVDISTSFDDDSSRFGQNIPRSQSATAGFNAPTSLHNGVSSSSRPSSYVEEKPKNSSSAFNNINRDDVGEPYSPIIGRHRSMYSSLRERRRRPVFDSDKLFNDSADFTDRGERASRYNEQDDSHLNGRSGAKMTADLHNLHGYQSASDFSSSSSKFEAHPRMSRTSHSEPNWAEKMDSTTDSKHSKPYHNGNVSSAHQAEDHIKTHLKGSTDQGIEDKLFPTPKRAGLQKINEDMYQPPTNSRPNNNVGESNESDTRKLSKAHIPKTENNTADSAKDTKLNSSTLNDDRKNAKNMASGDGKHDKPLNGSSSNGDITSAATVADDEELLSPTGVACSDDGGQSPIRSPTRTDSRTSNEDGSLSPQRTPTRLELKESKFTRLSKFRKVTRSGRSASVSTDAPNGAGGSAENSPISSPIMTRSKSVQEDTPGSLKKTRARKRPPIFVGTPLNFNCTIFDQDGMTAGSNDANTEASGVKENEVTSSNVVDEGKRENLMNSVVPEATEFVLETFTINSIEPVANLHTDNNESVVSECPPKDGLENRLLDYDREPVRRGSLHSSSAPETAVETTESQHQVEQTSPAAVSDATETETQKKTEVEQTPQQEMEDLCTALDELDALTLLACSEMEVVEEECVRNESTSLAATAADVVRTVSNIGDQKTVPLVDEISADDEQQMIDDICNELLMTAEDNCEEDDGTSKDGLVNGDVEKMTSDGQKQNSDSSTTAFQPTVDVIDSEATSTEANSHPPETYANETESIKVETNSSTEHNAENPNPLNDHPNGISNEKTDGDAINDDDSVFVENVKNGFQTADDQTTEHNRSPKIDADHTSSTNHVDHTDDTTAEPDTGFVMPTGVAALFDKSLVVADSGAGCLCLCNAAGSVEHRIVGLKPFSVAVAGADEKQLIYVGDRRRKTVVIFDRYGCDVGQWGDNQFDWVCGVAALPSGDLAILDRSRPFQLGIYSPEGEFRMELGRHGNADDELCMAEFLTVDSHGRILVADSGNHCIKAFDLRSSPGFITMFGSRGCGDGQLQWPKGVAVDARDNVLVADSRNSRLQAFAADGRPLCTVVRTVRSPYAISCVPPRTLAVTTYSVTGLSEFHLYDTASVESILQSS